MIGGKRTYRPANEKNAVGLRGKTKSNNQVPPQETLGGGLSREQYGAPEREGAGETKGAN